MAYWQYLAVYDTGRTRFKRQLDLGDVPLSAPPGTLLVNTSLNENKIFRCRSTLLWAI